MSEYDNKQPKYYYATIYRPFILNNTIEQIIQSGTEEDWYDKIGIRPHYRCGMAYAYPKTVYQKSIPIMVQVIGNKAYDIITHEEYELYNPRVAKRKTLKYNGNEYFEAEEYLKTTKTVVTLFSKERSAHEIVSELRKIDEQDKKEYKSTLDKIKNQVAWSHYYYWKEKAEREKNRSSDEEYIRNFWKK